MRSVTASYSIGRTRNCGNAAVRGRLGQRADPGGATHVRWIQDRNVHLQAGRTHQARHDPGLRSRSPPKTASIPAPSWLATGSQQLAAACAGNAADARHARPGRGQRAADVCRDRLLRQRQGVAPAAGLWQLRRPAGRPGWSIFVDDNNFPNTIDFESPMAFPSIRQAQVRWTTKFGAGASWSMAVEDNKSTIDAETGGRARQGRVLDARPDHAISNSSGGAATRSSPAFSAGGASARPRASPMTSPCGAASVWQGQDLGQGLRLRRNSPLATASAAIAAA